jgi:hypothetical protein
MFFPVPDSSVRHLLETTHAFTGKFMSSLSFSQDSLFRIGNPLKLSVALQKLLKNEEELWGIFHSDPKLFECVHRLRQILFETLIQPTIGGSREISAANLYRSKSTLNITHKESEQVSACGVYHVDRRSLAIK